MSLQQQQQVVINMSDRTTQKIAVFGSAFNPPTRGHQDAISQLTEQGFEVWLVPSFKHAWGKEMASYEVRCEMVAAFIGDLDNPAVQLMAIEDQLQQADKPIYSMTLMEHLQRAYPAASFALAVGPDNANNFSSFHRSDELLANWPLVVVNERAPIRSTLVRARIANDEDISQWVTPAVRDVIHQHQLYQGG
ncbi:nicotinate-nicotinamide nucleotide adenylyltransferase [Corallincola holothuriorum]|uniref:nicotinate-nucleotide adenylyltransferase n=2 Tax=Corallincola holothuriorum TaxID=2282215 RepID=A0A368NH70_9GAMM|nr:nicotinate-nicotinamide nucleotide adenylyltransferase [Corallincola holothuriorum]